MALKYDVIQTFFVSKDRVNQSPYCFITGVDLYFKNKPAQIGSSGILQPGAVVHLCEVQENHSPKPDLVLTDSIKRLSYNEIPLLTIQAVQEEVETVTNTTVSNYSPVYTGVGFSAASGGGPQVHRYDFNFASVKGVATLYFSGVNYGHRITLYRGGSMFFNSQTRLLPGISRLSSADVNFLSGKLSPLSPGYSIVKDNNIQGVGKIVWNHDPTVHSNSYRVEVGHGRNRRINFFFQYPSSIQTITNNVPVKTKKIITSSRTYGSAAKVIFDTPVLVKTDTLYGIVVDFESKGYELWTNKQGEYLIGSTTKSPGASGKGDGKYFDYANDELRPQNDRDIMFEVFAAKFTSNTANVQLVHDDYEFVSINDYSTTNNSFFVGEHVYQDYGNPTANATYGFTGSGFFTQGTVSVTANTTNVIGTNTLFTQDYVSGDYVVITDLTTGNTDVRVVGAIVNNTFLTIETPSSFSNTIALAKKTAVAKHYYGDYGSNTIILNESNANTSIKFQPSGLKYVTISSGGSSYDNTDILRVYGGGATLNATANVVTDGSGTIVALRFSNVGTGFVSAPSFIVSNSTALTSNSSLGSSASFTANINGAVIKGETSEFVANLTSLDTFNISVFDPDIKILSESVDTKMNIKHNFAYENSGTYYVNTSYEETTSDSNNYITKYSGTLVSRSLEVANSTYLHNTDKSSVLKVNLTVNKSANALYMSPILHEDNLNVFTFKYDVNNDATDEHTRYGNSSSKYVSKKITFANNNFAEDIRVFVDAYKPAGTDVKVYAKIFNSADGTEVFDDRIWSELELIDGIGLISSTTNINDVIPLTYGFKKYPTVANTLIGTVKVESANSTITGSGTTFTDDLANNDLIRIYDPLNANTNYFMAVATEVTNNNSIVINTSTTNSSVLGTGLKVDKILLPNEAFNNPQNFNIVRYYNESLIELDGYNVMAVKVVLLSSDYKIVPEVEDIRVIGVSA